MISNSSGESYLKDYLEPSTVLDIIKKMKLESLVMKIKVIDEVYDDDDDDDDESRTADDLLLIYLSYLSIFLLIFLFLSICSAHTY